MRIRLAGAGALMLAAILIANGVDKKGAASKTNLIAGVKWETSMDAAQKRAQKEGKPILLMHLFGRLDDEFC